MGFNFLALNKNQQQENVGVSPSKQKVDVLYNQARFFISFHLLLDKLDETNYVNLIQKRVYININESKLCDVRLQFFNQE